MNREQIMQMLGGVWEGVGAPTKSGLVINDVEVAHFLVRMADLMAVTPCRIQECRACDLDRSLWWSWAQDLAGPVRLRMFRLMRDAGIPPPDSPWEEMLIDAVFTPRD